MEVVYFSITSVPFYYSTSVTTRNITAWTISTLYVKSCARSTTLNYSLKWVQRRTRLNAVMSSRLKKWNNIVVEEFSLLGCNAVQSGKSQPMFRRDISPSSSGSKSKSTRNRQEAGLRQSKPREENQNLLQADLVFPHSVCSDCRIFLDFALKKEGICSFETSVTSQKIRVKLFNYGDV
jgi:hypothetical protein